MHGDSPTDLLHWLQREAVLQMAGSSLFTTDKVNSKRHIPPSVPRLNREDTSEMAKE